MATKTWVSTDGNWDTAGSWSPSGVPASSDDVYFVSGSQDVTSGFNQSGVTLNSINFGTKWTGSIGTNLQINSTTVDYANKNGAVKLQGTYTTINVQATSGDNPALTLDDSTITTIRITGGSGTVFVKDGTTVSGAIDMIGCKGARLEIESGATVSATDTLTIGLPNDVTISGDLTVNGNISGAGVANQGFAIAMSVALG